MDKYDQKKGTAVDLLNHYFKTVFEAAGLNWDSDNHAEIEQLVDAIVHEATTQAAEETDQAITDRQENDDYRKSFLPK